MPPYLININNYPFNGYLTNIPYGSFYPTHSTNSTHFTNICVLPYDARILRPIEDLDSVKTEVKAVEISHEDRMLYYRRKKNGL